MSEFELAHIRLAFTCQLKKRNTIFKVLPCINDVKCFTVQLMHSII